MPSPNMDTFNDLVMQEIDTNAVKVLKTHPRDILDRTLLAVDRVFVAKDVEEDPEAAKLDAAATILENLAVAIRNEENPLEIKYGKTEDGNYTGAINFKIGTEFSKTSLLPQAFLNRSYMNRVKAAAKKLAK